MEAGVEAGGKKGTNDIKEECLPLHGMYFQISDDLENRCCEDNLNNIKGFD